MSFVGEIATVGNKMPKEERDKKLWSNAEWTHRKLDTTGRSIKGVRTIWKTGESLHLGR